MNDKQLDLLLKAADHMHSVPPSFTRDVWRDIELRQLADNRLPWLTGFFEFLALPKPRVAVWALAFGVGILAGIRAGTHPADPVAIYAHSINPLAPALLP